MKCNYCGSENNDDAVYCKVCGRRLDGMMSCPKCKKLIDEDSEFCNYCGTSLVKSPKPTDTDKVKDIYDKLTMACALALVLLTLIFTFFTGVRVSAGRNGENYISDSNIFYYLSEAYKDAKQMVGEDSSLTNLFKAGFYVMPVIGTLISVATIGCVVAFSAVALKRTYLKFIGKDSKNGENPAFAAFLSYIFGAAGFMSLVNYTENSDGYKAKVLLNGVTIAGIIICSIIVLALVVIRFVSRREFLIKNSSLVGILLTVTVAALSVVLIELLSLPALNGKEAGVGVLRLSVITSRQCYSSEMLQLAGGATAAFTMGIIAHIALLFTTVCCLLVLFKSLKSMASGDFKTDLIAESLTLVGAIVYTVLGIVTTSQYKDVMNNLTHGESGGLDLKFGMLIAILIMAVVCEGVAVFKRAMLAKAEAETSELKAGESISQTEDGIG